MWNKILNNITDHDAVNNIIKEGNSLNDAMKKLGNSIGQYDSDGSFADRKEDTTKASDRYKYANPDKKAAYDNATEATKALINKDTGAYADQATVEKLTEAENKAWNELNGVVNAAKNAIDQAAKTKNDAIDASNLTAEEKDALKKTVAGEVQTAKDNIDAATKDADVTTAKNTGVEKINNINVPDTSATKEAAKNAIDQAAKTKNDAIDASNLTAEEKDALKKTVAGEVQTAKDNIDAATKDADVTTAKNTGVEKINNINVPDTSATKEAAKNAIDQAAKTKNDAIDASNLTAEEKDALKKTVAGEVQTAKDNIDAATKDADVTTAKNTGVEKINNINVPTTSETKDAAKDAIDQAAKTKDEAIDGSNLTAEEKDTLKQTVAGEVNKAKAAIDAATKDADVKTAQTHGEEAINNINVPTTSETKDAAKDAIDQAAKTKDEAIDASNLTDEEKDTLKQKVAEEAQKAKDNIDAATKDADVKTAQTDGEQAINNINVPTTSETKDAAKDAIDDALAKKIEGINNANLTDDQKQSLIDQAQNAANQAKENVRSASTDEDVQTAKNNGIAAINGITVKSNSVDDQDNSATNEGNGNQAGHIQSDNSSDVTKHSSTQQSGNEKDKLPQTGNETQRGAGLVGLAIAGLAILLGSAGFRKKRD